MYARERKRGGSTSTRSRHATLLRACTKPCLPGRLGMGSSEVPNRIIEELVESGESRGDSSEE